MAEDRPVARPPVVLAPEGDEGIARGVGLVAAGTVLVGLVAGGSGFLNGDAAAYAAQGWAADLSQRWVHLGYVSVAAVLGGVGDGLPRALDALSAVAGGGLVLAAARGSDHPLRAAWLAAACVLPWVAFAEVDLPCLALVAGAAVTAGEAGASLLLAAAVAVSPVSLLAMPWVLVERRSPTVVVGALGAVMLLSVASGGDWWWGDRGVLSAPRLPGRTAQAWLLSGTWLLGLWSRDRRLLALLPLLLAPPDVPAWVLLGVAAGRRVPDAPWGRGAVILAVLAGLWGLGERRAHVARAHQQLSRLAAVLPDDVVVEAPWSWGARWSVLASGEVYGRRWVAVPHPVRDQRRCPATATVALPPGREPLGGTVRVDDEGVHWGPGC